MSGKINSLIIISILLFSGIFILQAWKLAGHYTVRAKQSNYIEYAIEKKSEMIKDLQEKIIFKLKFDYDSTPEYYLEHEKAATTPISSLKLEEMLTTDFFKYWGPEKLKEYNSSKAQSNNKKTIQLYRFRIMREIMQQYYYALYDQGMILDQFVFIKSFQDSLYFGSIFRDFEDGKTKLKINDSFVDIQYNLNRATLPYSNTIKIKKIKLLNKGTYIDTLLSQQLFVNQDNEWKEKIIN